LEEAEVALREVLGFDLPLSERLPVLALLADVQLKEDSVETEAKVAAKLADAVKEAGGDAAKVCCDVLLAPCTVLCCAVSALA
jgi:hypothetical protein